MENKEMTDFLADHPFDMSEFTEALDAGDFEKIGKMLEQDLYNFSVLIKNKNILPKNK